MEIDPILDLPPHKAMYTCPKCTRAPIWNKESYECPICQFGRDMRLWSQTRWNRAVSSYEEKTTKRKIVPKLGVTVRLQSEYEN